MRRMRRGGIVSRGTGRLLTESDCVIPRVSIHRLRRAVCMLIGCRGTAHAIVTVKVEPDHIREVVEEALQGMERRGHSAPLR